MKKYENFASALANLEDAPNQDLNNDFVQSGLINKFNLQFELSWKLLKRLLEYEGATLAASGSPRAILKESYRSTTLLMRQPGWICSETAIRTSISTTTSSLKI